MKTSEQTNELFAALANAQGEIKSATKDQVNPHFRSSYAGLASVWDVIRGPLSKNKLALIQSAETAVTGDITVVTRLGHASGQWCESELTLAPRDKSPQAAGSAITYGRRYGAMAMVGAAPGDDDDGNAASTPQGRVTPEEPGPGDGVRFPNEGYRIPFGKFAKRSIEELDLGDLRSYVDYLEKTATKEGKPMRADVRDFISRAETYLGSLENAPIEPGETG